jgi:hypothetical protein
MIEGIHRKLVAEVGLFLVGMHQGLVAELRRSLLLIILNKGCDRGKKAMDPHGTPLPGGA